jgi:hypothetical protein
MPHPDSHVAVRHGGKERKRQTLDEYGTDLIRNGFCREAAFVTGDLGPIHLLRSWDGASHSPIVGILVGDVWSLVWVCESRRLWGWRPTFEFYVTHNHRELAIKYAKNLAAKIRKIALKEQERVDRAVEAVRLARERGEDAFPESKQSALFRSIMANGGSR